VIVKKEWLRKTFWVSAARSYHLMEIYYVWLLFGIIPVWIAREAIKSYMDMGR